MFFKSVMQYAKIIATLANKWKCGMSFWLCALRSKNLIYVGFLRVQVSKVFIRVHEGFKRFIMMLISNYKIRLIKAFFSLIENIFGPKKDRLFLG